MKKLSIALALFTAMNTAVFSPWANAETNKTDTGKELEFFYDFEGYNATLESRVMPDENWEVVHPSRGGRVQSATDAETGSTVMSVNAGGEPVLKFGETVSTGDIQISYDIKFTEENAKVLMFLYNAYDGNYNPKEFGYNDTDAWANIMNFSSTSAKAFWRDGSGGLDFHWDMNLDSLEFPESKLGEWMHVDVFIEDISDTSALAWYYIDGELINKQGASIYKANGFKGVTARLEGPTNGVTNENNTYFDNFYMKRSYGDEELNVYIKDRNNVDTENGVLDMFFTEVVDGSRITEENITITRELDGYQLKDFTLLEATDRTAKIQLNETLQSGRYNVKIDGITGGASGRSMINGAKFRTASVAVSIEGEKHGDLFNDYTAEPNEAGNSWAWPAGWVTDTNGNAYNSAAKSVPGKTGEDGDNAFGIELTNNSVRRPIMDFDEPIDATEGKLIFDFDIFSDGAAWEMHLLNEGYAGNSRNEAVIGVAEDGNVIKYADSLPAAAPNLSTSVPFEANSWQSVHLEIEAASDNETKYTIKVGDSDPETVTVSRDYSTVLIKAIGFKLQGKSTGGKLYIDNLKVVGSITTYKPEVDSITMYDYDGKDYQTSNTNIPVGIEKIVIKFNTPIADEVIKDTVMIYPKASAANKIEYNYGFNYAQDVLTIEPLKVLDARTEYVIYFTEDLTSKASSTLKAGLAFYQSFSTNKIADVYSVYKHELSMNVSNAKYSVSIAKSTADAKKYMLAICGYKTTTDSDGKEFSQLIGMKYIPVELSASDMGYLDFEVSLSIDPDMEYVKGFITEYPTLHTVIEDSISLK